MKLVIPILLFLSIGCQKERETPLERQEEVDSLQRTEEYHQKDL